MIVAVLSQSMDKNLTNIEFGAYLDNFEAFTTIGAHWTERPAEARAELIELYEHIHSRPEDLKSRLLLVPLVERMLSR